MSRKTRSNAILEDVRELLNFFEEVERRVSLTFKDVRLPMGPNMGKRYLTHWLREYKVFIIISSLVLHEFGQFCTKD